VLNQLFGVASDEFHTAIVARMRNAPSERTSPRAREGVAHAAPSVPCVDKHWDPAPLHSAFAPSLLQPALPHAIETGSSEHDRDAENESRAE
jgi:hypothetical protein